MVCLAAPARFLALGYHYESFPQLTDDEVIAGLRDAAEYNRQASPLGKGKAAKPPKPHG